MHGVAEYEKLDPKDLYTLGTVIVDYRGYRVVCQTIIPGEGGTEREKERGREREIGEKERQKERDR